MKRSAEQAEKASKKQKVVPEESDISDELDLSEDELDLSENEEESEVATDDVKNEDATKSREEHKKLLQERRLQRKSGVQVEQIKRLWERMRVRNPPLPKEVREKLIDETWALCEGVIGDLVLKHDASRVVQTLIKYSSKERRSQISKELEPYYYKLATSAYGKYLLVKMLHYGSKEDRARIIHALHGKYRKLLRHREGAYVLEDLFVLYASAQQRLQILKEFWGAEYAFFNNAQDTKTVEEACEESAEKKRNIVNNLYATIKASVEKGSTGFEVLHAVMREYIHVCEGEQLREFIELVKDQIAEMVHTAAGSEVASTVIAKANAKERKAIIKGIREHASAMAKNEYGHNVLQTLFMTVDDTKLLGKAISSALEGDMLEVLTDKYGRRSFVYLLNGLDKSYFSPKALKEIDGYMQMAQETSKKPQEKRREELLQAFLPLFYKTLDERPYALLGENVGSQFVQELLMNKQPTEERAAALDKIIECMKGDLEGESHLIHEKYTERLLKSLIQGGKWNRAEKKVDLVEGLGLGYEFASKFADELFDGGDNEQVLRSWIAQSPSAFVLVGLVDCFKGRKEANAKKFLKAVKKQSKYIAEQQDNKGASLLLKVL